MTIDKEQTTPDRGQMRGQSLVELALVLPIFLLLLLGVFEVGWALRGYLVLANANREAARFAARGVYLGFNSVEPDPLCPADVVGQGRCPVGCEGGETLNVGYCKILSHTIDSMSGQLNLDFTDNTESNSAMIVTYYKLSPLDMDDLADCSVLADPNHTDFEKYMKVEYPVLIKPTGVTTTPLFYGRILTASNTISKATHYYRAGNLTAFSRINPEVKVKELRAQANVLNCELKRKDEPLVSSNALIVENFYAQEQLAGLPFTAAFIPDPFFFYTHTTMRISTSIREDQTSEDEVCELAPLIVPLSSIPSTAPDGTQATIEMAQDWSDVKTGKLSFVYWDPQADPQATLAGNLQNPTNTKNFKDADNLADTKIKTFSWVAAHPGDHEAEARTILEGMVGQTIWVPVWFDMGCSGPPCNRAQVKTTQAIEVFTFLNMKIVTVDYGSSPTQITYEKQGYDSAHCTE